MSTFDLTQSPTTDPLSIYRYRDGLYAADLLGAALVWLDLFTWLDANPSDLSALCQHFQIQPRPTDVMVTLFKAMELLEEQAGEIRLTAAAREHLVKTSPWFIGPYYASMKDRPVTKDYLTVLRTGKPANWSSLHDQKAWAQAMEEEAFAGQFTAAMDCRGVYLGPALARAVSLVGCRQLLDIAGGSGIYACSLVAANPGLSGVVLEKPPVDRIARQGIERRGFAGRISVTAGDMVQEAWPLGADVHLLSNVLHDWDVPKVRELLKRSADALCSRGVLLIHDVHLNAEKTGPLAAAAYSALLMNITEGKCYSVREMEELLREAGFEQPEFCSTVADRSVLICKRAT